MPYGRKPKPRLSMRETFTQNQKAMDSYALIMGKPTVSLGEIPDAPKPRAKPVKITMSEHQIQSAIVKWWGIACKSYKLPSFVLFSVPNAAMRSPELASYLKSEGMRSGVPDLILDVAAGPYAGLRMENKTDVGVLSDSQKEFRDYYQSSGKFKWVLCRTPEEGISAITTYMRLA